MRKILIVGLILLVCALVGPVSAGYPEASIPGGVMPNTVVYNTWTCPAGSIRADFSGLDVGSQSNNGLSITLDASNSNDVSFSAASDPITAVCVKDGTWVDAPSPPPGTGNYCNEYKYSYPGVTSDGHLSVPPMNVEPLEYGGISGVHFCYSRGTLSPEFPTIALPVGMIVGFLGIVTLVRGKKEY